jgi:hypothetical protein
MSTSRARDSIQRTKMIDIKDMSGKILWTKGREAGIEAEQERIIKALRAKAATRTVLETLAAPFYIDELIETITKAQDD